MIMKYENYLLSLHKIIPLWNEELPITLFKNEKIIFFNYNNTI